MLESLLVVFTRPRPGQEDQFNDWYSNIHLHDAMRFRGGVATQRFKLAARQPAGYTDPAHCDYLALYEVTDAARFTQEHIDSVGTDRQEISLAIDHTQANDFYYYFCHFVDNASGEPPAGNVVMQQMRVSPDKATDFRHMYAAEYLMPATRRPGVRSGALLAYHKRGQMFPNDPSANFIAVYRLEDPTAMDNWAGAKALAQSPLVEYMQTSWWDVLVPRLTKDAVLNPTAELAAAEKNARLRMGDKIIQFATATDIPAMTGRPGSGCSG
jgi:hypothetical protein